MKKPKHSPTPWRTDVVSKDNIDIIACPEDADTFRYVARECTDADAALIVRAVNSHEALVEALREADRILWMAKEYAEAGGSSGPEMRDYNEAASSIRAALALAEKPE